ncbi:MAG: hypothetical protein KC713_10150, partial [Candidatus Omnitrophica bacterium]|nr:hypothetical protein [Candidatus Omnitrophota bacterium]
MKFLKVPISLMFLVSFMIQPVYAQDVSELKTMIQELRSEYESKIEMLENKIEQLETNQQRQVEAKVNEKIITLKRDLEKNIEEQTLNAEYVGRDHERFGKGGMVVDLPVGSSQVSVGGYMDHEFENFENTDSTFDQHRWIINIAAQIGERLRFMSEYEIEHGGPDQPGGEAKVEQAYVDYLIADWVNFRAGAVLAPFGRTNIYHDSDLRDLTSRPLVARDIIPTTWTEAGGGFFGDFYPTIGAYEDLEVGY